MEPRGAGQVLKCFWHNCFEVLLNVLIIIFAQLNRSFVSAFFIITTHLLLFTPTMSVASRLNWDLILLMLNLAILTGVILAKQSVDQHLTGLSSDEYSDLRDTYMNFGF
jgi:hypothetical protein